MFFVIGLTLLLKIMRFVFLTLSTTSVIICTISKSFIKLKERTMLEIKNVHKTYKPKKGVPVKALDGVSLSFADTGLVFILGKSGSGKSTLLNVIGGLDVADSGEFSIKGKSSKDFSQADFDSYRNTFIGFIFQEYNILNEFTVGQNIALAMKLQGRKVENDALNAILEEVDLAGYANRKPNELSGGQKQRVAIARALIKEPEIIMADEPTGALDSNTGRQVFDTLKKLSKNKLVIVVSHDREFAEYYGDRVIELADGQVISDITKETAQSYKESDGLSIVDNKIFHIRKGYKLTSADMKKIQSYIDNAESDTIISLDGRSNASFCQIARIDKDGNQEVFKDTDNQTLSKENEKYDGSSRFIRSKLPYSHAFKIGANSVRTKPLRLFITIFLCLVSFAMFGLADTIGAFNAKTTTINSIIDSKFDSVVFTASLNDDGYAWQLKGASQKDKARLEEKTGMKFQGVLAENSSLPLYERNKLMGVNASSYYSGSLCGYLPASQEKFAEYGFGEFKGRMPAANDEIVITKYAYEQFALAGFLSGNSNTNEAKVVKSSEFENIEAFLQLEPELSLGRNKLWRVVGVVDTKADAAGMYEAYKPSESASDANIMDYMKIMEMEAYFEYGYHSLGYVSEDCYKKMFDAATTSFNTKVGVYAPGRLSIFQSRGGEYFSSDFSTVADDSALSEIDVIWIDGTPRTTLADNEYVVGVDNMYGMFNSVNGVEINLESLEINFDKTYFGGIVRITGSTMKDIADYTGNVKSYLALSEAAQSLSNEKAEKFREHIKTVGEQYGGNAVEYVTEVLKDRAQGMYNYEDNVTYDDELIATDIDAMSYDELRYLYAGYLYSYNLTFWSGSDYIQIPGGMYSNAIGEDCGRVAEEYLGKKIYYSYLVDVMEYNFEMDMMSLYFENGGYGRSVEGSYKIVGVYVDKIKIDEESRYDSDSGDRLIINNAAYAKAKDIEPTVYSFFIAPMPSDRSQVEMLVALHYDTSGERGFAMQNGVTVMMGLANGLLETLGQVFLYVGIGLAVFSMLLMSNYIAVSISYKKREIGILRAVGAKSSDVFSIFFSESLIIALINFVLASIVCGVGCMLLNGMIRNDYHFEITLLNFGFRQIGLMLLISVGVALIASFLPVFRLSRKKPIETIRTA